MTNRAEDSDPDDETMRDVSHTSPNGDEPNRVWSRGRRRTGGDERDPDRQVRVDDE